MAKKLHVVEDIFLTLGILFLTAIGVLTCVRHKDTEELVFGITCLMAIPLTLSIYYIMRKYYLKKAKKNAKN